MKKLFKTTTIAVVLAFVSISANAQVTQEQMISVLRGDVQHTELIRANDNGRPTQRVVATMLAGVRTFDDNVAPTGTLRLGYEVKRFIVESEGTLTMSQYSQEEGYFPGIIVGGNIVYKFWHKKGSYFGLGANAGYAFQSNSSDSTLETQSSNYGLSGGAFIRYSKAIKKAHRLKFVVESGYKFYPETNFNGNQTNVGGVFAQVGLSCVFF